jgi:hypothetical protein
MKVPTWKQINVCVVGGGKSDGCHESRTCVSSNDGASL